MSARAELVSMVNDIRLNYDRGQGALGEVADRVLEICRRVIADEEPREARVIPSRTTDPATSHSAAKAVTVRAGTQRAKLLIAFMEGRDATDEEAMERAEGVSPLSEYSKRCSELREAGMIEPTGETRPGGSGQARIVSAITERGLNCLLDEVL